MSAWRAIGRAAGLAISLLAAAAGCSRPGGPFASAPNGPPITRDAGSLPIAIMSGTPPTCTPATASEVLPPRTDVVQQAGADAGAAPTNDAYFTADSTACSSRCAAAATSRATWETSRSRRRRFRRW